MVVQVPPCHSTNATLMSRSLLIADQKGICAVLRRGSLSLDPLLNQNTSARGYKSGNLAMARGRILLG